MNEKPILFSGPMVRAILDGRKTQTRRIIKPQPERREAVGGGIVGLWWKGWNLFMRLNVKAKCPYGAPGDRLWVRETFHIDAPDMETARRKFEDVMCDEPVLFYMADFNYDAGWIRRPSIFMPRWASRLTLEIKAVRVERVQAITYRDCEAEGMIHGARGMWSYDGTEQIFGEGYEAYKHLWTAINGVDAWDTNPWVWVVEFEKVPNNQRERCGENSND